MISSDGQQINGDVLANALLSGIHRVIGQQELLNRINVFPVADGDTGTNLSLSLSAALGVLQASSGKHLGTMLAATADAMLDGARGNSGAIIAQFFQGMSDATGDLSQFTPDSFGKAVRLGSKYAHDALSKPCEGTVLSVIAAFATSIARQVDANADAGFATVIDQARREVDTALANTPNQLDVLRKAGVVDAGAKGFAELVAGMSEYLRDGHMTPMPATALLNDIEPLVEFSATDGSAGFRYCTECLVTAENIERRKLREALTEHGDSMVLAGSKRKARIHIHVDDPDAVFAIARRFGDVSGEKADDMHRQQRATHGATKAFAVITDSGADICDDDMERLDIHMVPCRIQFGDRGYLDKVSITTAEFYHELENNSQHPTSSRPAPGDFRRQFQFLASHFSDVLAITLTSGASGTYEGALSAAKRSDAPGRIHVLDSLNASVGQGQLVVLAAECAAAGIGIEQTKQIVKQQVAQIRVFALLQDLRYAVRGGRLPRWVKWIADLLRVTPVICVTPDGRLGLSGFLLGRRQRITRLVRFIAARVNSDEAIEAGIGQAICPHDAAQLATELRRNIPAIATLKICELGTGIGVHGGPGTVLVAIRPARSADEFAVDLD